MKGWRMWLGAAVFLSGATAGPARAEFLEDAGWGVLTVFSNLGYMPLKLVYSTLGGVTGGLAYVCTAGHMETAQNIWVTSMGGTYVLTPGMLKGQDPIAFAGTPSADANADAAADKDETASSDPKPPASSAPPPSTSSKLHEQSLVTR
jgi:hypothetical protein